MRKPEPAISRVLSSTTIHLGQLSPAASSNLPGSPFGTDGGQTAPTPLFGLAPGGVYRAASCCQSRGALLPHLFTLTDPRVGGIFSVALSMGSRPPGVTWRPVRRSPDFPLHCCSDCLADSGFLGANFTGLIGVGPKLIPKRDRPLFFANQQQAPVQIVALAAGRFRGDARRVLGGQAVRECLQQAIDIER